MAPQSGKPVIVFALALMAAGLSLAEPAIPPDAAGTAAGKLGTVT